jgi:hypothetical protein
VRRYNERTADAGKGVAIMEQRQSQYQGAERRQSQSQYQGDERRKPDPIFEQTTWIPGNEKPEETWIRPPAEKDKDPR